ncbi:MAG TPA: hypothetical protein VFB95_01135 [Candidatus Cryosericum sp.]|nr:hypothetical protein [Candidatus Cryosericum sp.]
MSVPRARGFRGCLLPILLVGSVTLVLAEGSLRLLFEPMLGKPPANAERSSESEFWQRDEALGWSHIPNASGTFTNGAFDGEVHFDSLGNRQNSAAGTFIDGHRNIFFLGDSTTASLEVDDDETVPALLERRLRAQGWRVNVVNLGVRGYGTDQSVAKALQIAGRIPPAEIIYMFTDNDVWDNSVLRQAGRRFGKGVYWRPGEQSEFVPWNYPVPEYPEDGFGFVLLDEECRPRIQNGSFQRPERPLDSGRRLVSDWLYLPRAIGFIRHAVQDHAVESIDPSQMISGPDRATWSDEFSLAYTDAGAVRARCASYFDDQLRFLLGRLRTIRGLERLTVVHFPDWSVNRSRSAGRLAPSVDAFEAMVRDRTLDGYLDLTKGLERNGAPPRDLQCPYDSHFCEQGNAWIAAQILQFTLRR